MAMKRKPLTREGEPTQKTPTGLEIPIPTREEFFGALNKAARKQAPRAEPPDEAPEGPSRPDPASR